MMVVLAFAVPAFDEINKDWRNQGDFAVTFLDRYGNEIGQRGIIQRDSVPLDEMPDHVDQGGARDRGPALLRAFRHRLPRPVPRACRRTCGPIRSSRAARRITQQLAKNLFLSNERTVERKIKEAFLALWLEANLSKKEILQALSRPRLYGRRHFRHRRPRPISISASRSRT